MQTAQQQNHKAHSRAAETAPYATHLPTEPETLQTVEEDVPSLRYKLGAGLDPHKVDKYKSRLEEKRKQVGLINNPTTELQEAEKCLAEVGKLAALCHHVFQYGFCLFVQAMAMQEELEARKAKEYRLTAFTGDFPY